MTKKLCVFDWVAGILVIIGAINWGLVGAVEFNLVTFIFGDMSTLSRAVYVLVGVSGLWMLYMGARCCKVCCPSSSTDNKPKP